MGFWTGLGSAIVGGISNLVGGSLTNKNNQNLARQQNKYNLEQWQRENAYNHPAAQKARLEAAGLNADMMYGQGGISNTAASSPHMTGGAPSVDWSSLGNSIVSSAMSAKVAQAQIDNLNADTKKKGAETSILSDDAAFRKAYNQGVLDMQNVQIRLTKKQGDLTDQEIKESQAKCTNIEAQTTSFLASAQKIYNDIKNDNARLDIEKSISSGQLRKMASECSLNYATAEKITKELDKVLRNWDDVHDINVENLGVLRINKGVVQFNAALNSGGGYDSDLSAWENVLKFANQVSSSILGNLFGR